MPESRKRPGHQYQKPSDIPASQKTKGRIIWSILLAIFAVVITWFATERIPALIMGGLVGACLGYVIGKSMEQDAKKKD